MIMINNEKKNLNSLVNHIAKPGIGKLKDSHIPPPGKSDHLSISSNGLADLKLNSELIL